MSVLSADVIGQSHSGLRSWRPRKKWIGGMKPKAAWIALNSASVAPLVTVILVSWGIAFIDYLLQVPANRIGYGHFSAAQLKTIQEVISLTVFAGFSWLYLGERLGWQHAVGFGLICAGAWFVFHDWG